VLVVLALAAATVTTVATSRGEQPLQVYLPAHVATPAKPPVLLLSGEGGWRSFDDRLARWLSDAGYPVGGIDCMKYFWKPQDDRGALAADVALFAAAIAKQSGHGGAVPCILAGYSFGADLAPWIAGAPGRPPAAAALVLVGPDLKGSLEARISEILGLASDAHTFDTAAALRDAAAVPVLFIHGGSDRSSAAPALASGFTGKKELIVVPGATHHFAGHEEELRRALIDGLDRLLAR